MKTTLILRISAVLLTAFAAVPQIGAQPAGDTDPALELVGTWSGERRFGPVIAGELLITREAGGWQADLAGFRPAVSEADGVLSFRLPGDLGRFFGRIELPSGAIHGQWVQPGARSMFGQRFSTPVQLEPRDPGSWAGRVEPLPDRVRLYLVVEPDGKGGAKAFLRNPEVNAGRFLLIEEVRRDGDEVSLDGHFIWDREGEPQQLLRGSYHPETGILSLFVDQLGGSYDLRRLEPGTVTGYTPRPAPSAEGDSQPFLRRPPRLDDGWPVGDLATAGMAPTPIRALIRQIVTTPMVAIDSPFVEAVLIARHGKLVVEEYFHGHHRDRTHDTRSASKSFTATLVGAAVRQGAVTLDTGVYQTLTRSQPSGGPPADLDPRAHRMTLEHLITMTSGLACDDWDSESPGSEDRMQNQHEQPDWHRYLLDLPMEHEPGAHAAYCSGGMSLAGAVVARRLGQPLTEAFDRLVARPLEMGTYHTNLMPDDQAYAGGGLRVTARDFLKLGQLMLDDGVWNGRRILNPGWSAAVTTRRHDLGNERLGAYGAGWWLLDYEIDGRSWKAYYAGGNGGNYVIVVPELELVVAFQASNYNQSVQHQTKLELVPRYVIRSAVEGAR